MTGEFLQNRSVQAIINLYDEIAKDLIDDMEDACSEEFYIDGYAASVERASTVPKNCETRTKDALLLPSFTR